VWYSGQLIPTNIITGFLGTGKTTAILELLKRRPAGERWSVFVNEYGMVSIDDVLMESQSQDVQIQELAGGCFCCTTSAMMDTVLMQFIRRTKPDRLLIEPSGAGHPARVIDALRGERFRQALDLRATICLVDPKDYENPRVTNSEGFHDQIQMSDVVAINWTDKRERPQIDRCLGLRPSPSLNQNQRQDLNKVDRFSKNGVAQDSAATRLVFRFILIFTRDPDPSASAPF
jgi:G3E family GTPase